MSEREMRQVLLDLSLTSMTRAVQVAPSSSGQKPGSVIPSLGEMPPADFHAERWNRARSVEDRSRALRAAREECDAIRRGNRELVIIRPESREERAERILARKNAGWEARLVAEDERVPLAEVIRAREDAGLDPALGKPWPADEDRDRKILRLKAAGMTSRGIASACNCSRRDVDRVIREAA